MRNIRETLNRALIVGGLITMGGAAADMIRTGFISPEAREVAAIENSLERKFHVHQTCTPGPAVACVFESDIPMTQREKELAVDAFTAEFDKKTGRQQEIITKRLFRDMGILGLGAIAHRTGRAKRPMKRQEWLEHFSEG